jgi:site-specific recombinase XerD
VKQRNAIPRVSYFISTAKKWKATIEQTGCPLWVSSGPFHIAQYYHLNVCFCGHTSRLVRKILAPQRGKRSEEMFYNSRKSNPTTPWNKGRLIGQKMPLAMQDIWAIRTRLQDEGQCRELALFNLALDSKLRACDLLKLRVSDVSSGNRVNQRATVLQQKTGRPVRFEITRKTRRTLEDWIEQAALCAKDYLFPSRIRGSLHLSTRQYSRIVTSWVVGAGLDAGDYGTHSLRRTKATLLYRKTKNLRAVQLLLGHSSLDSTVRYLGIEIDDALAMSEQIDL